MFRKLSTLIVELKSYLVKKKIMFLPMSHLKLGILIVLFLMSGCAVIPATPNSTSIEVPPAQTSTLVPISTPTPKPTFTPTPLPTNTPTPTSTSTDTPTSTPTVTPTVSSTTLISSSDDDYWALAFYQKNRRIKTSSAQKTKDGGYVIAGHISFGRKTFSDHNRDHVVYDVWIMKLNRDGVVAWQQIYSSTHLDIPRSIQETSDGSYLIGGITFKRINIGPVINYVDESQRKIWMLKLNKDGTIAWKKTFGDYGRYGSYNNDVASIQETRNGRYILGSLTDYDIRVLKLDQDGTIIWQKTYDTSHYGCRDIFSAQRVSGGGYILTGSTDKDKTDSYPQSCDLWILKLTNDGSVDWQKYYEGTVDNCIKSVSIQEAHEGGYILLGSPETWMLKLNQDGTVDWQRTYEYSSPSFMQKTSDGGYILTGKLRNNDSDSDSWILKLNRDGTVGWQKIYGGQYNDHIDFIQETDDGNYIAIGETTSFGAGWFSLWILRLNGDGDLPACAIQRQNTDDVISHIPPISASADTVFNFPPVSSDIPQEGEQVNVFAEHLPFEIEVICGATDLPNSKPIPTPTPTPFLITDLITDTHDVPMVLVPAGTSQMGGDILDSVTDYNEIRIHSVNLDAFYIDQYEVTNSRYATCVEAGVCSPPVNTKSYTRDSYYGNPDYSDYPVMYVNWEQAKTYCEWRGGRLPTEAEWEKTARGTDGRTRPWGEHVISCDRGNFDECVGDTTKVGAYPGGVSPYGAYDMTGNVWEWVADWFDPNYYSQTPLHNPQGPAEGTLKVVRGGSWRSGYISTRAYRRSRLAPDDEFLGGVGFRCATSAPGLPSPTPTDTPTPSPTPMPTITSTPTITR